MTKCLEQITVAKIIRYIVKKGWYKQQGSNFVYKLNIGAGRTLHLTITKDKFFEIITKLACVENRPDFCIVKDINAET